MRGLGGISRLTMYVRARIALQAGFLAITARVPVWGCLRARFIFELSCRVSVGISLIGFSFFLCILARGEN